MQLEYNIFVDIPAEFSGISTGTPSEVYPDASVGIVPIIPPGIASWIHSGVYLEIFLKILPEFPLSIPSEISAEILPEILSGNQPGTSLGIPLRISSKYFSSYFSKNKQFIQNFLSEFGFISRLFLGFTKIPFGIFQDICVVFLQEYLWISLKEFPFWFLPQFLQRLFWNFLLRNFLKCMPQFIT